VKNNSCTLGLDDRCRDSDGSIRRKRGDTLLGTLRNEYGEDFAPGIRSDARLDTLLERSGATSLSDFLRNRKYRAVGSNKVLDVPESLEL
jgi:hypothetical protein